MTTPFNDQLVLSREEMHRLGRKVMDILVDHIDGLNTATTGKTASAAELSHLREKIPNEPASIDDLLELLQHSVFANTLQSQHPRFFAWVPGPSNFLAVLSDALASGYNVFAGTWLEASGPAEIERTTIAWLTELVGFPQRAGGVFVSGGSAANLMGLGMARQAKAVSSDLGVAYCSEQTHSSVSRAFRFLNIQHVRSLETDDDGSLHPEALAQAVRQDLADSLHPFLLVSNLGTTNTGAVDRFELLQPVCERFGLWHHVDAAYGGGALLSERVREFSRGLESTDSIAIDPHKWLFQAYECGCLLVRDRELLDQCFYTQPEYLTDTAAAGDEINFAEVGLQLTRRFRALKLWLSMKSFGARAFQRAVDRGFALAELTQSQVDNDPSFQLASPAQLGIVCFRYVPPNHGLSDEALDDLQLGIVADIFADGFAVVHTTVLRSRRVIRMCTINPRTTDEDITKTLERIRAFGEKRCQLSR